MKGIILSAGYGKRMRPFSDYIQKTMLPLADGKPIMHHIMDFFITHGVEPIIAISNENYGEQVRHYCNTAFNRIAIYTVENKPMGTAGAVLNAKPLLENEKEFLIYYGDSVANINFSKMVEKHRKERNAITLCGKKGMKYAFGVIEKYRDKTFVKEKPPLDVITNIPILIVSDKIWKYLEKGKDLFKDTIPTMIADRYKVGVFEHEGEYWDVGRISDYDNILEVPEIKMWDYRWRVKDEVQKVRKKTRAVSRKGSS